MEPQIYANKPQKPTEYQIKFQLHHHFVTKPPHSPTIYNFFILHAFQISWLDTLHKKTENFFKKEKNLHKDSEKPSFTPLTTTRRHSIFVFRACEIAGFDREKRIKYERDMISERDYLNIMDSAEERGRVEGRAEGRMEGRAEVARAMFAAGMDIGRISSLTGLTGDQLNSLRA